MQWEGDVKEILADVKVKIDAHAEKWTRAQKDASLAATPETFMKSGLLLRALVRIPPSPHNAFAPSIPRTQNFGPLSTRPRNPSTTACIVGFCMHVSCHSRVFRSRGQEEFMCAEGGCKKPRAASYPLVWVAGWQGQGQGCSHEQQGCCQGGDDCRRRPLILLHPQESLGHVRWS